MSGEMNDNFIRCIGCGEYYEGDGLKCPDCTNEITAYCTRCGIGMIGRRGVCPDCANPRPIPVDDLPPPAASPGRFASEPRAALPLAPPTPGRLDNGTYIVRGPRGRRTFRIRTKLAQHTRNPAYIGKRLFEQLTGPDLENSFNGLGWIEEDPVLRLITFRNVEGNQLRTAQFGFAALTTGLQDYRVEASTTCRECNRKLTTPESIARGIGPECAK